MTEQLNLLIQQCRYQFPNPCLADPDGEGLIVIGGDLAASTLITAYSQGLFPWFNEDDPIAWWCPEPRCVMFPEQYQASKSLKRQAKKEAWTITVDKSFENVICACSLPRAYQAGTWITQSMIEAYVHLHQLGLAHSIEVWDENQTLIGGLYGLKIGQCFFGESMFHHKTNASKMAFWGLNHLCVVSGIELIDCQLVNPHLLSLGARTLSRPVFLERLRHLINQPHHPWKLGFDTPLLVQSLLSPMSQHSL